MNKNKQKISALLISAALIAVLSLSLIFLVKEAGHQCTGEDCPVCAGIHQIRQSIRQIGGGEAVEAAAVPALIVSALLAFSSVSYVSSTSLITQKVRMDN